MENFVFLAVLFAAACHAGWNALIKVGLDPLSTTTLISLGAGFVALALADRISHRPSLLLCIIDRKLPHGRSRAGLSDRTRIGAVDDGGRHHRLHWREIEPDRMDRDSFACGGGAAAVSAWRA